MKQYTVLSCKDMTTAKSHRALYAELRSLITLKDRDRRGILCPREAVSSSLMIKYTGQQRKIFMKKALGCPGLKN